MNEGKKIKSVIKSSIKEFSDKNNHNDLSSEWTYDIVEYLQSYYGFYGEMFMFLIMMIRPRSEEPFMVKKINIRI